MQSASEGQPAVPEELRRFVAADWRDENDRRPSGVDSQDWPLRRTILAFKRFLAGRREFESRTGVHIVRSWERWAADRRGEARSLAEFNMPYELANFVESEDGDPRRVWER